MKHHNLWLFDQFKHYKTNHQYSLRRFAELIDVSPSLLSLIFKGEREISEKQLNKILIQLNIPLNEQNCLKEKYAILRERNKKLKERLRHHFLNEKEVIEIELSSDIFLKLIELTPFLLFQFFKFSPKSFTHFSDQICWAIKHFNFSNEEVLSYIELLKKHELLIEHNNILKTTCDFFRPKDQSLSNQEVEKIFNQYAKLCLDRFLPCYNEKGEVATSLNKQTKGFDVISWDYLYLSNEEVLKFKNDLILFQNKIIQLSQNSHKESLNYYFMGSQFFKLTF